GRKLSHAPAGRAEHAAVSRTPEAPVLLARRLAAEERVVRMVPRTIRKVFYSLLGAIGIVFALSAFYLLSRTAQNASDFDELQNQILLINAIGVVALLALIIGNLARLVRD